MYNRFSVIASFVPGKAHTATLLCSSHLQLLSTLKDIRSLDGNRNCFCVPLPEFFFSNRTLAVNFTEPVHRLKC